MKSYTFLYITEQIHEGVSAQMWWVFLFLKGIVEGLQLFLDIGNNEAQAIHFTSKKHSRHFIEKTIGFKKTRATVECLFFRVLKFPEYFKTA